MAYSSWPSSLPQFVLEQGFSEQLGNAKIETAMEAGRPKSRRRYTAAPRVLTANVACDATQRATLITFYETTLKFGSLPFDWVDPVTQVATSFIFRGPPPRWAARGNSHIASFGLETVP